MNASARPASRAVELARSPARPPPSLDEACRLFFTPSRARETDAERRATAVAERFELHFGQLTLPGYAWGAGPSVFLVHGWSGRAAQLGAVAEALARAGLRALAVDAPAHGASPGERSSLLEFAEVVAQLARHQGSPQAVIAHSMGAASTAMALRRGLRSERVVLIAPIFRLRDRVRRFARRLDLSDDVELELVRRIEGEFGPTVWEDSSLDHVTRDLDLPALVVHDRQDSEIPFEDGERTARAWRGARLLATSGLGHRSLLRHAPVLEQVVAFCAAVER